MNSSQPLRVVVIMPVGQYRGGAEELLLHFTGSRDVAALDIEVIFLEDGDLVQQVANTGVPVHVWPTRRVSNLTDLVATVWKIRRLLRQRQPDLVLGWMNKGHIYGGLAGLLAGVPAAYFQLGHPDKGIIDRLSRTIPAVAGIACSRHVAELQARVVKHPVEVVHLSADVARFHEAARTPVAEMKARLGLDPTRPVVGMVGRLQSWKGMHHFVEAWPRILAACPGAQGVIVGGRFDGEPDYAWELRDRIAALGMKDQILMAGPQSDVPNWVQAMDVFVHASRLEPFGIVIVEAMSLGKAVLACAPGGPAEIVKDGKNGLLIPWESPEAISAGVIRYLRNPAEAQAHGEAARERAEDFTEEAFVRNLDAALRRILKRRGCQAPERKGEAVPA